MTHMVVVESDSTEASLAFFCGEGPRHLGDAHRIEYLDAWRLGGAVNAYTRELSERGEVIPPITGQFYW